MVIGHYALGFALKRIEPRLSLGILFLGVNLVDILIGLFLLTGIEHARYIPGSASVYPVDFYDYPYTHSLAGSLLWSLVGVSAYLLRSSQESELRKRCAVIFGISIFSHYLLDLLTHTSMPLLGNDSLKIGMGLYENFFLDIAIEAIMLAAAVAVYRVTMNSRSAAGDRGLISLVVIMLSLWSWSLFDLRWEHLLPGLPDLFGMSVLLVAGNLLGVALGYGVDRMHDVRVEKEAGPALQI